MPWPASPTMTSHNKVMTHDEARVQRLRTGQGDGGA
jgi:hypothetical protein